MANTIPVQVRAVDPFAEYNSNSVNRLTRIVSKGTNCILSNDDIDVIPDSTSHLTYVLITAGSCIKDEMLIAITSDFRVDFADADFYVNSVPPFNEAGNYYVVLDYTYDKVRPAPQASIKILKPSQVSLLTSDYLLLKVIDVIYTGSAFNINGFMTMIQSIVQLKESVLILLHHWIHHFQHSIHISMLEKLFMIPK